MENVSVRLKVNCCDTCTIRCGLPNDLCPMVGLSYHPVSDTFLPALAEASKKVADEEMLKSFEEQHEHNYFSTKSQVEDSVTNKIQEDYNEALKKVYGNTFPNIY